MRFLLTLALLPGCAASVGVAAMRTAEVAHGIHEASEVSAESVEAEQKQIAKEENEGRIVSDNRAGDSLLRHSQEVEARGNETCCENAPESLAEETARKEREQAAKRKAKKRKH